MLTPSTTAIKGINAPDGRNISTVRYYDMKGALTTPAAGGPVVRSILYDDGTETTEKIIK